MTLDGGNGAAGAGTAPGPARPYTLPEGRFALPGSWLDQSIHIFAVPGDAGGLPEFSLVVHREAPLPGEDLAGFAERQRANLRGTLPEFRLVREGALALGGAPAREVEFRWTGEPGLMHQRQVVALHRGRAVVVTGTAPERLWAKHAPGFAEVLASWRFQLVLSDPRVVDGRAGGDAAPEPGR